MTSNNRLKSGITRDSVSRNPRTPNRRAEMQRVQTRPGRRDTPVRRLDRIRKRRIKNRRMMIAVTAVAFLICIVIGIQTIQKYSTLRELREQESKLQAQYEAELQLSQELKDKEAYVKTDEYVEEMARRLGLLYPNEIIFKSDK